MTVEFGHIHLPRHFLRRSLPAHAKRDDNDNGVETKQPLNITLSFGSRLVLFPLHGASEIDIGLPFSFPGLVPPVTLPDLNITCVNCGFHGSVIFHGKFDYDIFPVQRLQTGFIELNVTKDLVARLELEITTGGSFLYEFETSLLPITGTQDGIRIGPPFGIPGILSVSPYLDYGVGVSVEVEVPQLNMTVGGNIRIPKGASVKWDIVNANQSHQLGWDVQVDTFPLTVNQIKNTSLFSVGVNFTSIPALYLNLELLGGFAAQAGGKLALYLPRIYTKASLLQDVTEKCEFAGEQDFEYFPYGISLESGLHAAIIGELYAEVGIDELNLGAETAVDVTIWEKDFPFPTRCFLFGASDTGLGSLRNASAALNEKKLDVKKVEDSYIKTGQIPAKVKEKLENTPDLPPDLCRSLTPEITMPRSTALHMS